MPLTYEIELAGVKRKLPLREVKAGLKIAFFQLLGDVELCEAVAKKLVDSSNATCDVIVAPESKAVPLAHEISRLVDKPYVILRKSRKSYMQHPLGKVVESFTTEGPQQLWIDREDVGKINGKGVWVVDDVMTTGGTLRTAVSLVEDAGGRITEKLVVLKEGVDAIARDDVIALGELPIFTDETLRESGVMSAGVVRFHHRALELRDTWPVVYTAVSKHRFCYRALIGKFVFDQHCVPVNPAMNFAFDLHGLVSQDAMVTANNNVIRMADEVWVFGTIGDDVMAEIVIARELGMPVRFFRMGHDWGVEEISSDDCEFEPGVASFVRE